MKKLFGICFAVALWLTPCVVLGVIPEGFVDCSCPDGTTITCLVSAGCYPNTSSNFYGGDYTCEGVCTGEGHGAPATLEPDPEPDPEPSGNEDTECSALPTLDNFTISGESTCDVDKVYLKFVPNGDPGFYLNVQVEVKNGHDELSAWCSGSEELCKVVGNGQACSGNYSGVNAWCYKAN